MKGLLFKGFLIFGIVQILFLSEVVFAQSAFQGQVEAVFSYNGDDTNIDFFAKDGMARVELEPSGKGMKSIFIIKNNTLYMLSPNDNKYTETPIRARNKLRSFMGDSLNKNVVKTNETIEIHGYNATKWTYQGKNDRIEIWNTNDLGNIINTPELFGNNQSIQADWIKNLFSGGFFPLKAVQYDRNDKELRTFEVKKVDKKDIPNNMFTIPVNYRKMNSGR